MYWLLEIDGWYPRLDERVMVTTYDSWVLHIQVISPEQTPVWIDTYRPTSCSNSQQVPSMGIEPQKTDTCPVSP